MEWKNRPCDKCENRYNKHDTCDDDDCVCGYNLKQIICEINERIDVIEQILKDRK